MLPCTFIYGREKADYFISLSSSYQDQVKMDKLSESMNSLRIDLSKIPMIHNDEVDVTNDMIGLMVDLDKKGK